MNVSHDFRIATQVLEDLTVPCGPLRLRQQHLKFAEDYHGQAIMKTVVSILNKAVIEGTEEERTQLLNSRHEIIALNELLANPDALAQRIQRLNWEACALNDTQGMQIALPQTKFQKMIEVVTKIPRAIIAILIDLILLPIAGILLLVALCKPNFDPTNPKQDKTPILLVHGSGFNETEWVLGRQFLKKDAYGSVFSLNYDGLASNDPNKGVEDYAETLKKKIEEIKIKTGQNRVILIGHSLGGLVSSYYAENVAKTHGMTVENVISIATPWHGSPLLRYMSTKPKRYGQMHEDSQFLKDMVITARRSERKGLIKYFSVDSSMDPMVPAPRGTLTEDPRRQRTFTYLGHYGIIASPRVWMQVRSWLDGIYAPALAPVNAPQQLAVPA